METIYHRVLGERFALLHPTLRYFLGDKRGARATGRMTVRRPPGWLRRLAGRALGLPPAGEYELVLVVTPHGNGQRWDRHFGTHVFTTYQYDYRGLLLEAAGPGSVGFELVNEGGTLHFRPRRAWLLGIPVPLWLVPGVDAENVPLATGGWRVIVRFRLPLLGPVGEYEGEVVSEVGTP